MPLPATWFAMSDVGAARRQGSDSAARADTQVHCLLWRGQSAHRQVRPADVRGLQCRDVQTVSRAVAASSNPGPSHDHCARQCSLPSCRPFGSVPAQACSRTATAVFAALQPAARPDRARLEADSPIGNSQPLLPDTPAGGRGSQRMLQSLAAAEFCLATTMLHYLRRHV